MVLCEKQMLQSVVDGRPGSSITHYPGIEWQRIMGPLPLGRADSAFIFLGTAGLPKCAFLVRTCAAPPR